MINPIGCTCSVEEVANLSLEQNRTLRSLREFEHCSIVLYGLYLIYFL